MNSSQPGRLIVFEGIDGTGKSTQISLLNEYLTEKGYSTVVTREPTDGIFGRKIRELYVNRGKVSQQEELNLFLDDRREHVENLLLPALVSGKIVLCDRYYLSTAAYQGANGFDPEEILRLNKFAPQPDIALLFEIPIETSLRRITEGRGDKLNAFEQAEALERVNKIFTNLDLPYIHRIYAEKSIAKVHQDVILAIQHLLPHQQTLPLA